MTKEELEKEGRKVMSKALNFIAKEFKKKKIYSEIHPACDAVWFASGINSCFISLSLRDYNEK